MVTYLYRDILKWYQDEEMLIKILLCNPEHGTEMFIVEVKCIVLITLLAVINYMLRKCGWKGKDTNKKVVCQKF